MRNSIRTRLLVFSVALVLIPLLLINSVSGIQTFNAQSHQASILQAQIAGREASQVSDFFQSVQTQLQTVASEHELRSAVPAQQQIILAGLLNQSDVYNQIFLLDSKGQEQVGVARSVAIASSDLVSRANADEFKVPVTQNTIYYGPVHTDPISVEPIITIGIPIENFGSGAVDGVLVADIRFYAAQGLISDDDPSDISTGNHSTIYMLDASNHVVADNDPTVALRNLTFVLPGRDGVQNGLSGSNVELAASDFQLGTQTFTVVAETSIAQALAPAYNTALFSAILTIIVLIIAIAATLRFVTSIVRPIVSLAATARIVQSGDFSAQSTVMGSDEIGSLAQAFNNMVSQLRQTLVGLQEHVEELDEAKREQQGQREFLRQILDAIPDVIQAKDKDGRITLANEATARYYGTTSEAILGKTIGEINPNGAEVSEMRQSDAKVFETGMPLSLPEQQVTNAAGETRWNQTVKLPIFGKKGEVDQVLTVAVDISDRKQAEEAQTQLVSIIENTTDFISSSGPAGNIIFLNDAGRKMVGLSSNANLSTLSVQNLAPPQTRELFAAEIIPIATQTGLWSGELTLLSQVDGHEIPVSAVVIMQKDSNGVPIQTSVIMRDITERKLAEEQREALIKDLQAATLVAQENSRLKSEFLSTMSHELRTPLNAIEGFTGILINKIGGTDYNTKTEGYLTRIRLNSKRLLQLINDFLDLSRVEAGRLDLANQPFSPVHLAKRWQDEIGILAEKKGLQLIVNIDPTMPETAYGDEEAISKVVINLLGNAIKFTEHGQVNLDLAHTNGQWNIVVEDTGIGIPPHAREFIFEEFRQVDQSSQRKYGGTGLGLAIVQKYARAMGGTVQVKSEFGKGSTFSVSIPMKTTA